MTHNNTQQQPKPQPYGYTDVRVLFPVSMKERIELMKAMGLIGGTK
jgi:hypothetical protein